MQRHALNLMRARDSAHLHPRVSKEVGTDEHATFPLVGLDDAQHPEPGHDVLPASYALFFPRRNQAAFSFLLPFLSRPFCLPALLGHLRYLALSQVWI